MPRTLVQLHPDDLRSMEHGPAWNALDSETRRASVVVRACDRPGRFAVACDGGTVPGCASFADALTLAASLAADYATDAGDPAPIVVLDADALLSRHARVVTLPHPVADWLDALACAYLATATEAHPRGLGVDRCADAMRAALSAHPAPNE
jgi:hypothetical protein